MGIGSDMDPIGCEVIGEVVKRRVEVVEEEDDDDDEEEEEVGKRSGEGKVPTEQEGEVECGGGWVGICADSQVG